MSDVADRLEGLNAQLRLVVVDQDTTLGVCGGIPMSMNILGQDPLALLFGFRVKDGPIDADPFLDLLDGVPGEAHISFEDGYGWLTLFQAGAMDGHSIRLLAETLAAPLASAGLAGEPGCVRCGSDEAVLRCAEGCPTRLCPECLESAAQEREEIESLLNQPRPAAVLALPMSCLLVVCGWAVAWTSADAALQALQLQVIEANELSGLILAGFVGGTAYVLGVPLGNVLRRSGLIRRVPKLMSVAIVLVLGLVGEALCIAVLIWRTVGVFDLALAAGVLPRVFWLYSGFWISLKVAVLVLTSGFCAVAVSGKVTAPLRI